MRSRLLAFGFGIATSLGLLELALRVYNPVPTPVRANDIVMPVNKEFRLRYVGNPKVDELVIQKHNELGLRGPSPRVSFDQDLTLITVGGSTTECVALTDGHTWPDHVFERLSARHPEFWLNNAGRNGHSTFGHLMLIEQYLAALRPDYVLYLIGANEAGRDDLNDFDRELLPGAASLRNRVIAASELLSTVQVLSRTLRAIDLGVSAETGMRFETLPQLARPATPTPELLELHASRFLPAFRARVERIISVTRAAGIEPILATQPALLGQARDPTLGVDLRTSEFSDGITADQQWQVLELYNDVTRAVAREANVPLIDLARSMPKDSRYYFDWIHYSVEGAERVGALVADELERILPWH